MKHWVIFIYRIKSTFLPFWELLTDLIHHHLNIECLPELPNLQVRTVSRDFLQVLSCIALCFNLATTVKTPRWASHKLNVLIVALGSLQLPNDVLDMLKAVSLHEFEIDTWIADFLIVTIFTLFIN